VIGIVTSSAGAALHDMLRILRKRYPLSQVLLLPARVQGTEAPGEIASAIRYANRYHLAELLIVGRGGGSIEDLWAFNDERVAYAIYESHIPVISAVGHEPDVTISDYVADLRAATPSNAAELAVPDQDALRQTLDTMTASMVSSMNRQLKAARMQLHTLSASPGLQSPLGYIHQRRKALDMLQELLYSNQIRQISLKKQRYIGFASKLDALSPLKVLTRGYALPQLQDGSVVRSVKQVNKKDRLCVTLADGNITAEVLEVEVKENVP
jgi:exodeoxyribonuclease VII large subunit